MKAKDIQYRGHCQCCGNQQAVIRGHMSQHGYTVKHGWFEGVCGGHRYPPIEAERISADMIIGQVRQQAADMVVRADALEQGRIFPETAKGPVESYTDPQGRLKYRAPDIPFAEASRLEQREAVKAEVFYLRSRARMGESFANDLERIANDYHGKPLIEVVKPTPPALIHPGEKRRYEAGAKVLTARYQDGARVYWTREDGFKGWTGTQAWRRMELIEG